MSVGLQVEDQPAAGRMEHLVQATVLSWDSFRRKGSDTQESQRWVLDVNLISLKYCLFFIVDFISCASLYEFIQHFSCRQISRISFAKYWTRRISNSNRSTACIQRCMWLWVLFDNRAQTMHVPRNQRVIIYISIGPPDNWKHAYFHYRLDKLPVENVPKLLFDLIVHACLQGLTNSSTMHAMYHACMHGSVVHKCVQWTIRPVGMHASIAVQLDHLFPQWTMDASSGPWMRLVDRVYIQSISGMAGYLQWAIIHPMHLVDHACNWP